MKPEEIYPEIYYPVFLNKNDKQSTNIGGTNMNSEVGDIAIQSISRLIERREHLQHQINDINNAIFVIADDLPNNVEIVPQKSKYVTIHGSAPCLHFKDQDQNVNYGKEFWKEDGEPETGALGIIYHQLICGHCKERKPIGGLWAYCPYCGAKMYTDRYMKQDGSIEYTNASIV